MSQASALGRQILDLTVILIPLCFEKPSHAAPHLNHTFLNCLFFFQDFFYFTMVLRAGRDGPSWIGRSQCVQFLPYIYSTFTISH